MADAALQDILKAELTAGVQLRNKNQQHIDAEHLAATNRLYKRRQELASGKATPIAEELEGFKSSAHKQQLDVSASSIKGVPYFWLNVLCNQDIIAEELSSDDRLALSYCTGVRAVYTKADGPPTIELSFSSNPFFSNSTLKRCLGDAKCGVGEVTTDIKWKDTAHKLTVKEVKKGCGGKKGKKGGKGKATNEAAAMISSSTSVRLKPCPSFFTFFLADNGRRYTQQDPAAAQDSDNDEEVDEPKSAKAERDELLMRVLVGEVLPQAYTLYMSGPLHVLDDEDVEEGGYQLVHGNVGSPADLPGPTQAILAALAYNQIQLDALAAKQQRQKAELQAQEAKVRQQLADQRRALLVPAGAKSTISPRFWLRVLRSADAAALAISRRDAAVLAALTDVRFQLSRGSKAEAGGISSGSSSSSSELHGTLELEFSRNQYLAPDCKRLVKEYSFTVSANGEPYLLHSHVTAAPAWASPQMDPTVKQGKDGKARPACSIFQLFKQGGGKYAFNLVGAGKEMQAEANELEVEMLMELHSNLLLNAGSIYKSLDEQGWPDDDTDAGDKAAWLAAQQVHADESDSEKACSGNVAAEDEGEAAQKAAARRSKAKAGGFKITKAGVLIGLVVLMLLAELFIFLDEAGIFRSKR